MEGDARSFRVALTADCYVNPPLGGLDGLAVLAQAGWGVMQLPPEDYPTDLVADMLAEVAEQAQEFSRHGYELVLVGECDGLDGALATVGLVRPPQVVPTDATSLANFLKMRPEPAASHLLR